VHVHDAAALVLGAAKAAAANMKKPGSLISVLALRLPVVNAASAMNGL